MRPESPYVVGPAIDPHSPFFFGRDECVDDLFNFSRENRVVQLHGPRRSGKTSVLLRVLARFQELSLPAVYVDAHDIDPKSPSAVEALLTNGLDRLFPELAPLSLQTARTVLLREPVLILDEAEVIEHEAPELLDSIIRHAVNAQWRLIASVGRTVGRHRGRRHAHNARFARSVDLGPFDLEVVKRAVRSPSGDHIEWTDDALRRIHALSGGLPLLVNALADTLWRTVRRDLVSEEDVNAVAGATLSSIRMALLYVWEQGTEQRRCVGWLLADSFGAGCEESCVKSDLLEAALAHGIDQETVTAALRAFEDNWLLKDEERNLKPTQPLFWRFIRLLGEGAATAPEQRPDESSLRIAREAAEEGRWDVVRQRAEAMLEKAPQDRETLILRARSMWNSDKRDQALAQLRTLTDTRVDVESRSMLRDWLAEEALRVLDDNRDRAAELIAECRALDPSLEDASAARAFIAVERAIYERRLDEYPASSWGALTRDAMKACPRRHEARLAVALSEAAFKHFDTRPGGVVDWVAGSTPLLIEQLPSLSNSQATLLNAAALVEIEDVALAERLRQRAAAMNTVHADELLSWALDRVERARAPERAMAGLAGTRIGARSDRLHDLVTRVLRANNTSAADLPDLVRAVRESAQDLLPDLRDALEIAAASAAPRERRHVLSALLELPESARAADESRWRALAIDLAQHTHPSSLEPAQVVSLRAFVGKSLPNEWAEETEVVAGTTAPPREFLQQLLGTRFLIGDEPPRPFRIAGAVEPSVLVYQGREDGERVSIRYFDLRGAPSTQRRLLEELWANEQRSLYGVGLRVSGRALVRLRHAVSGGAAHEFILAVTDDLSRSTLRGVLERDPGAFSDKRAVWRSIVALIEGVRALHQAGCMHRAVRPESVFVVDERLQTGGEFLKLGSFEFSIYLTSLARHRPPGTAWVDRYSLPAAVHARLGDVSTGGESLAGDVYGLALLTFELIVRPFSRADLARCFVADDYREDEHRFWIEGLRVEVDSRRVRGEVTAKEALVFKALLNEALEGGSHLDEALRLARECATFADLGDRRRELFAVTTTTTPGQEWFFGNFVREELGEELATEQEVLRFLRDDLRDARVYANASPEWRLLVHGRRLTYRARAFVLQGQRYNHVAYLEVARAFLPPRDAPLGQLSSVEPFAINSLRQNIAIASASSWHPLFDAASNQSTEDADVRRQLGLLRMTLDLEADVWSRQVYPYSNLEELPAGEGEEKILIRDPGSKVPFGQSRLSLAHFLRQLVDREGARVDLTRRNDPTASFHSGSAWTVDRIDDTEIVLRRARRPEARRPPTVGFLRPLGLAGSRTLHQRRGALLERLQEDTFLLRTIEKPYKGFNLGLADPPPVQERLDENKRALARLARNRRPLVLVQGPPGTGKTTLASEVILEALRDGNASRILVTAQSHEPLNNMLLRVDEMVKRARLPSLLTVRLTREERLDPSRWGEETAKIGREFSPGEIARNALERASEWEGGGFPKGFVEMFRARVKVLAAESTRSVTDRIVAAANIIYATTNDRALFELQNDSFDLVIIEEAARALPLELLAPMSLGRRWLLIGDHQQLPPFGLGDFHDALSARVRAYTRDRARHHKDRGSRGTTREPEPRVGWSVKEDEEAPLPKGLLGYDSAAQLQEAVRGTLELFRKLHGEARSGEPESPAGTLLVQWRMHPRIAAMLNEFYPDLRSAESESESRWHHPLIEPSSIEQHSLVWIDMPHCTIDAQYRERAASGGGFTNRMEIIAIRELMRRLRRRSTGRKLSPYFLSPYRAQVFLFRKMSDSWSYPATEPITQEHAVTVDSFQGRQASAIVLSLVRNNENDVMGFLDSDQRATVAFSRAESLLIVVGCSDQVRGSVSSDGSIRKVYDHINEHGLVIPYERLLSYPVTDQRQR